MFMGLKLVGASRFERPTTRTPNECATRLRHAPNLKVNSKFHGVFNDRLNQVKDFAGTLNCDIHYYYYFSISSISLNSFLADSMAASTSGPVLPFSFFLAPAMV